MTAKNRQEPVWVSGGYGFPTHAPKAAHEWGTRILRLSGLVEGFVVEDEAVFYVAFDDAFVGFGELVVAG